jgi:hypothetical protein
MSDLASIESLEIALARCRKKADALANEYLAYLLDMAILEARSISRAHRGTETAERSEASVTSGGEARAK